MDLPTLTNFFMWCTIINGIIFVIWNVVSIFALDAVFRSQSKWFPIPRETFVVVLYAFLGFYKILFLMFCLVPFLALLIIG